MIPLFYFTSVCKQAIVFIGSSPLVRRCTPSFDLRVCYSPGQPRARILLGPHKAMGTRQFVECNHVSKHRQLP